MSEDHEASWLQLSLELGERDPDWLEEILLDLGALAVTMEDGADQPILEPPPGATPLWDRTRITGLFPGHSDPTVLGQQLRHELAETTLHLAHRRLADQDWVRVCLENFKPLRFGERLWVCPTGKVAGDPDAVVVNLDPGLAFGTGSHPTTALCLKWLDSIQLTGKTLIDYGCGSGILSIAALKLGAKHVWALDIDPQALLATRSNAIKNGVEDRLSVVADGDTLPTVELLMANILATPLINLAPRFQELLAPGGHLVLSGLLTRQQSMVSAAYRQAGFNITGTMEQENWIRLEAAHRH